MAAGYKFPQIFKVKADDGITDLYGVMYKPFDFDSTKKYPVVEYVYPGPQTEAVNKAFARMADQNRPACANRINCYNSGQPRRQSQPIKMVP